jgi:RNA polymerase-associated protein CTR9
LIFVLQYEAALSKDRPRDAQILACLGRVWLLKGKQEKSISAMKTALDYAQRARSIAPEQIHLDFNVAFVQNQIALLVCGLPETQRTLQDVEAAAIGLDEAIESFSQIARAKNPPYPRGTLEQRANMGRNTIRKQLERAMQSQKEYEEKNATKLQQAREAREAERRKREEEQRKADEAEMERKRQIAEERQQMFEEAQRLAAQRAEEERAREAAEYTTDSDTGTKVKRKKKAVGKRKKKEGDEEDGGNSRDRSSGAESSPSTDVEDRPAPRKRRRLERRSTAKANRYKSSEIVIESESEEEASVRVTGGGMGNVATPPSDQDEEMRDTEAETGEEDNVVQRRRKKVNLRIEDDEDDEEADVSAPVAEPGDDLFDEMSGDEAHGNKSRSGSYEDTQMKDQIDEDE